MRRVAAVLSLSLVLAGCAKASPEADLQSKANDVVSAANAGDAAGVRTAGGLLLQEVQQQSAAGDISATKAQAIRTLVTKIMANARLLEQADEPSPSPSSEAPSPTPSPEPSPTEAPSPSPEPSPTEAPPSPDPIPSVAVSPVAVAPSQEPQPTPSA
jgi:outer membrane biosynthesis protein TonB